ncbi:MAG: hypothetical protein AAFU85_21480 [Planctomycetota bacterium]
MTPSKVAFYDFYDHRFDESVGLLRLTFQGPTYHSNLPIGSSVHPFRESGIYAIGLLQRESEGDSERANQILEGIVAAQDQDPDSKAYGVWPWHLEEPLESMPVVDPNWADFMGALIAQALVDHSHQLPSSLTVQLENALRLAAVHIRRRDVGPGYTNIAVLGGCVCAAAGELLGEPTLLEYGRERLKSVVADAKANGGFAEYNSPPYSQVVIGECERTLQLVKDPETRAAAKDLWERTWQVIVGSYHPSTQQWAGPHSRAGSQRLKPSSVQFLNRRTSWKVATHPAMESIFQLPSRYLIVDPISAEGLIRSESTAFNQTLRREFVRSNDPSRSRIATTWKGDDACLGSINYSSLFVQRKPLIGYWSTPEDPAIVFACRCLSDGNDFASMGIRSTQQASRIESTFEPMKNLGYTHTRLDRPPDNRFLLRDVRIRYQLRGNKVRIDQTGLGQFRLSAGERAVELTLKAGAFFGQPIRWEAGREGDVVYVDIVCWRGQPMEFDFSDSDSTDISVVAELVERTDGAYRDDRN